jgi:hypothetical protein
MRQVVMAVGLITHDVRHPVGQIASDRKFPAVSAFPSDRDRARRRARTN